MKTTTVVFMMAGLFLLVACSGATPSVAPPAPAITPEPVNETDVQEVWSSTGDPNKFDFPCGLTVDSQSNLYVTDSLNHRVQKFDSNGNFVTMWGSFGDGDGQFSCMNRCQSVSDNQGNIYVADIGNARVQKFDNNGKFLAKWGTQGSGDGQFLHPTDIAVDAQGNVYVIDVGNSNVQKFDSNGKFLAKWGNPGYEPGQFSNGLDSIAIDSRGNIFISDAIIGLEQFDSSGKFVGLVEKCGDDKPIHSTTGAAVDSDDNLYFVDMSNFRICVFDSNGTFMRSWNGSSSPEGPITYGGTIAVDQQGSVYVSQPGIDLVRKFKP